MQRLASLDVSQPRAWDYPLDVPDEETSHRQGAEAAGEPPEGVGREAGRLRVATASMDGNAHHTPPGPASTGTDPDDPGPEGEASTAATAAAWSRKNSTSSRNHKGNGGAGCCRRLCYSIGPSCGRFYFLTCFLSTMFVYILMGVFCLVFALVIHAKPPFDQYVWQ